MILSVAYTLYVRSLSLLPLLAQAAAEEEQGRSYNISWALVLLCIILGMFAALNPTKRSDELRVNKDDE